jgi:hypothetical protein
MAWSKAKHQCLFVAAASAFAVACGSGTTGSGGADGGAGSASSSGQGPGAGSGAADGASGADTDAAASSAAPGGDAGCPMGKNACGECESMHCCPQSLACASDPQCVSYINCVAGCGATEHCYQSCNDSYPSAAVAGENLELCVVDNCPTPCGDLAR